MALGKNIEHLRKLAGYTRRTVARGIGIEEDQAIYALETRDSARSEYAPALAKFFSIDLETLVTQDLTGLDERHIKNLIAQGPKPKPEDPGPRLATVANEQWTAQNQAAFAEQLAELIRLFGQCSPTARNLVLNTAKSAAEHSIRIPEVTASNKS